MSHETLELTPALYEYLQRISLREPPLLRRLREETAAHPHATMQICPEQGQFMALLVKLIGARRALEIGVFTGYSSTITALALPEDGQITACDIDQDFTAIARRYWQEAGIEHKIDLHIAPALDTLNRLMGQGAAGNYDLVFIDADKRNYPIYYEKCFQLVRPGGVILIDNVLWAGQVADPSVDDEDTEGIRQLNASLLADERVDISLLPMGDGLTLVRKH